MRRFHAVGINRSKVISSLSTCQVARSSTNGSRSPSVNPNLSLQDWALSTKSRGTNGSRNNDGINCVNGDDNDRMLFATALARRAGELGLEYFRQLDTLTIESKGHQDMVSEADRDVEPFIRREIAAKYPDDGIVGEEHAAVQVVGLYLGDRSDRRHRKFRTRHPGLVRCHRLRQGRCDRRRASSTSLRPARLSMAEGRRSVSEWQADQGEFVDEPDEGSLGIGFSNRRETRNVPG